MLIRLGYELIFDAPAPVPMLLLLSTHPSRVADLKKPDELHLEPSCPREDFLDDLLTAIFINEFLG